MESSQLFVDLVTVIIPVYNGKKYLSEALRSVIHQSYQNLEILVVDDGSTDGSAEICDQFAARDRRIRVIHQENKGLSAARNAGIEIMTGQALMFLDADDAFHPNIVQILLETMNREKADIVMCKFSNYRDNGEMKLEDLENKQGVPDAQEGAYDRIHALQALADIQISISVWNKLYRKELWNSIRFSNGHVFEDLEVSYQLFELVGKAYVLDRKLYLHRLCNESITSIWSEEKINDYIMAYNHYNAYISSHIPEIFTEEQLNKNRQFQLNTMMRCFIELSRSRNQTGKQFRNKLKKRIIDFAVHTGIKHYSLKTKTAYLLLRFCPWLLIGWIVIQRKILQ
ncbi:MAG: glycosyltransferase family 2 protein [Clostridia bacterium]|nr:glycosyltransferase family 2 protein [Clostridia bacterium]